MPIPSILVRGKQVELVGDAVHGCIQPAESGLEFLPTNTRCKPREGNPTLITIHNKGGEGDGKQTYNYLKSPKKRLSVEFSIDRDGTIWQYCDPAVLSCAHMGAGNTRSIGVEVANTVIPFDDARTPDNERRIFLRGGYSGVKAQLFYGRGNHVELYRDGIKRRVLDHLPAQKKAVRSLVRTLLSAFPTIPARLPRTTIKGTVTGDRMPADWTGVAGHLHFQPSGYEVATAHIDPALDVFDELLLDLG